MSQKEKLSSALGRGFGRIPDAVLLVLEWLVLLAVLAAAWKARSGMPAVPISDPDTWGYLNPALSWLGGLGFQQTAGRDWFYPALLTLSLKTTGSFAGIALWQKFVGISSGLVMAVSWRCWVSTLRLRRPAQFFVSLIGALPISIQLMNPQSILFEMAISPEAVLPFFVYAQFACLIGYYKYRWQTPRALPSMVLGAAAIVLSFACLLLKPSWLFSAAITAAPVFAGLFGSAQSIKTRLFTPVLGVVFSLLILWLPSAAFFIKDTSSIIFLPDVLFSVHAKLIEPMLEARLAALSASDPQKPNLQALVDELKSEIRTAEAEKPYEKLGFNADYLITSRNLVDAIYRCAGNDNKKFRAFCFSCYADAALYDPLAFGRKIWGQFTYFLFPNPATFFRERSDLPRFYRDSDAILQPELSDRFSPDVRSMYLQYKAALVVQGGSALKLKSAFPSFRQVIAPLALPLEILFLLAFAASLVCAPLRDLRLSGWAAASLFSAPLGNAAMASMVHALDVERFRLTYGGFLLFALAAMAVFASVVIARALRDGMGVFSKGPERT
jgi:uncharacterized membrane protein YhaH (DUF805 family)